MKKAISLIASFLCALSCLTMAGCGKKKTTEVYFLNFKPESATVYEELAKKYDTELPIIEQVNQILFEGKDPKEAVSNLMLRDSNTENSLIPWPGQRN